MTFENALTASSIPLEDVLHRHGRERKHAWVQP